MTFYGRGFVNTTALACRFALSPPVPATFVSPNELFCETPPLFSAVDEDGIDDDGARGLRWSSLSEIWQRESDPLTASRRLFPGAHYHPLFSQRAVGVEVSRLSATCYRRRSVHTVVCTQHTRRFNRQPCSSRIYDSVETVRLTLAALCTCYSSLDVLMG